MSGYAKKQGRYVQGNVRGECPGGNVLHPGGITSKRVCTLLEKKKAKTIAATGNTRFLRRRDAITTNRNPTKQRD